MARAATAAIAALVWSSAFAQQNIPQIRIDREVGAARQMEIEAGQNRLLILSEQIVRIAVANPEIADLKVVTPNQVLLTAKGVGSTDLTLWNRDDQPLVIALNITRGIDALRRAIKDLFPGEKIQVSAAGDLVVLSGQVSDLRIPERVLEVAKLHAPKVANLVQVSGEQQVQLEVRFAEVSRAGIRELGVNFFHKSTDFKTVGGVTRTSPAFLTPPIPGTGSTGLAGPGFPPEVPTAPFGTAFNIFFSQMRDFPFSAILSLLEQNNLAKTLAEPTLATMSGQPARFLAGGELPIPIASTLGTVTVEWKKFGIILEFTPTVISDAIHLKMRTEVSDIDPTTAVTIAGTTVPGLVSRQSETTIRLGDGQSFAVAGLLSDRVRSNISRIPLLGSIPVVGALFRSTQFQRDETELLVVVTARLAQPVAPHELPPLPTDYEINDPGSISLFLFGSEGSASDVPRPPRSRGPAGQVGFTR
jgi:pilus assembly protein CpaC